MANILRPHLPLVTLLCKGFFGMPQKHDSAWPMPVMETCFPYLRNSPQTSQDEWIQVDLRHERFSRLLWAATVELRCSADSSLGEHNQVWLRIDANAFFPPECLCFSWQSLITLRSLPESHSRCPQLQASSFSTLSNPSLELTRLNLMATPPGSVTPESP